MPGADGVSGVAAACCLLQPAASTAMTKIADDMIARVLMSVLPKLETEDPHDAALARVPPDVFHVVGHRTHVCRIAREHVAREQEPVAADAGINGDVLLAIRATISDRITHHAGTDLEL